MADGIFQIDAVVNGAGVETGVQKAKKSIAGLADEAKKSGRETTRSLGDAGKAGEQSATKLDGATKRLIGTIERQTLAMGKSKAEYYEALSAVRKLDQEALAPYIRRLREAEAAQTQASGGLTSMVAELRGAVPLLGALGITLSAGQFVRMVTGTADAADALAKLSQKVGISVEDLSRLQYAAELSGVSQEKLSTAMTRLSQRMSEGSETFKKLGIETRNADGSLRNTRDVMGDLADVFARHSDGAGKSAAAMDLMGRSGADLIPLLNSGSAGLREMGDESDRLGNTLSTDVAKASEQFNDNLTRIKTSMGGLAREIAGPMIESLATLTGKLVESRAAGESWIATIGNMLFRPEAKSALDQIAEKMQQINAELQKDPKGMLGDPTYRAALERELAAAIEQYQKLATAQGKVGESADAVKPKIDALSGGGTSGSGAGGLRGAGDAAKRAAEQLRSWADQQGAAAQKLADSSAASTERIREQLETIGLTSDELARYRASKLETAAAAELHAAAELESAAAILRAKGALPDVARAYRDLAAARRQAAEELETQAGLTLQVSAAQAAAQAAKDAEREWRRTSQSIEQSLTDALMRGFESGKDFGKNLRDTLVNMFKTLVLRPIIQPIAAGAAGAITGAVSGGGASGSGAGNLGTSLLTTAAGSMFGAGGLTGALLGGAGWLTGATTLTGSLAAAGSLLTSGTAAGLLSGGAMAAGALAPIALPLLALAGGLFGKNKPTNFWQGTDIDVASGSIRQTGSFDPSSRRFNQANRTAADEIGSYLLTLTQQLSGLSGTSPIDQLAVGVGSRDKHFTINGVKTELPRASIDELVNTVVGEIVGSFADDLPERFRVVLESMTDEGDRALEMLVMMQDEFSALSTESERFERAQREMSRAFDGLGVTMPRSVDEFKRLAAGIDLTTTEGRDLYSGLYQLAPAFQQLASVVDQVFDSISRTTAQSIRDIELSVLDSAGKYAYLDAETDRLIGELTQATVPDDINRLFESINRNITTAFGLLDSGEQKRLATQFIDRLLEVESIAQSRLSVSPIDERTADEQAAAATAQREAAEMQRQAAREQHEAAAEARRVAERLEAALRSIPDRITVDNRMQIVASEVGVR